MWRIGASHIDSCATTRIFLHFLYFLNFLCFSSSRTFFLHTIGFHGTRRCEFSDRVDADKP
jgi:hypothetical protein